MPLSACRVLFIPNEKAGRGDAWQEKLAFRLCGFGFSRANVHVFDAANPADSRNLAVDAVYISGGNTFATLSRIRTAGFEPDIIRYVYAGAVYIGGSAGAHLAGTDLSHVRVYDRDDGLTDASGFGFWNGRLICHFTEERREHYERLSLQACGPVYALGEDDSLVLTLPDPSDPSAHGTVAMDNNDFCGDTEFLGRNGLTNTRKCDILTKNNKQ